MTSTAIWRRPTQAVALCLGLTVVGACNADGNTIPVVDAVAHPHAPKPADQAAVDVAPAVFVYSPVGKRDPFRSYLAELAENNADHGPVRQREETEQYEIDQYRLTGIITGTSQPKAMVEDPTSRGHVLKIGSRLGKNGGRVTRVSKEGVVVVEETRDPTGKKVRLPINIRLPKSEFEDVVQR